MPNKQATKDRHVPPSSTPKALIACAILLAGGPAAMAQRDSDTGQYSTPAGELFNYTKAVDGEDESIQFDRDGQGLTLDELRDFERRNPPPAIAPDVMQRIQESGPNDMVEFIVLLGNRPLGQLARDIRAQHAPTLARLSADVLALRGFTLPIGSLSPQQEQDLCAANGIPLPTLNDIQLAQIAEWNLAADAIGDQIQAELRSASIVATRTSRLQMRQAAAQFGGEVVREFEGLNGAQVQIPAGQVTAFFGAAGAVQIIGAPRGAAELDNQKQSLGLTSPNGPWANGTTGWPYDAAIIDTGVQQDHPNLAAQDFITNFGNTDSDGHGTGVAGIIASSDNTFHGMAHGTDKMYIGSGSMGLSDAAWAVLNGDPEVINFSWGQGSASVDDWDQGVQAWDGLLDDCGVLLVKSCGNSGAGTTTITKPGNAYNCIGVANIFDQNTVTRSDDVRWSSSSRGPTKAGRKKPDMAAPGASTMSLNNNWSTGSDFASIGGTSAAAPHVSGGVLLVMDARGSDDPLAAKAVLLNTADTWTDGGTDLSTNDDGPVGGSQWNKTYGWGYLDLWEALYHAGDVFTGQVADANPDYKLFSGYMFNDEKATLTWNRHVGWNNSNAPGQVESFTDLDLYLYDRNSGGFEDSSLSYTSNVEQVAADDNGQVIVKIEVFGSIDPDVGQERYALATEEHFFEVSPPSLEISNSVGAITPGQHFVVTATVTNNGQAPAHNVNVTLNLPGGYTPISATNVNAGTIFGGGSVDVEFVADSPCQPGGLTSLTTEASSYSYSEHYTDTQFTFFVPGGPTPLTQDDPYFADDPQRVFGFDVVGNEWAAVGISPDDGDRDLSGDNYECATSPFALSTLDGDARDFFVVNGHLAAAGENYARVFGGSAGDAFAIEYDLGFDIGFNTRNHSTSAFEVVEPYEWDLDQGERYRFSVDVTTGAVDFAIFGFDPSRVYATRASADRVADDAGAGGDETMTFVASEDGVHAFVLVNDNHNGAIYDVTLERVCLCEFDGDESGVTVLDLLAFLGLWFAQDGGAEIVPDGVIDVLDLLAFMECWFSASSGVTCP